MKITTNVLKEREVKSNIGLIEFKEINMKADILTSFEYDTDEPTKVTFIYEDANGKFFRKDVDLSEFNLDINYILNILRGN